MNGITLVSGLIAFGVSVGVVVWLAIKRKQWERGNNDVSHFLSSAKRETATILDEAKRIEEREGGDEDVHKQR